MDDFPRANRAQKIRLSAAAIVASFAHQLEHLRPPIDDDGELLAREGSVWQGGLVGTFRASTRDPKLSHSEALRLAMLAMIEQASSDNDADPRLFAPFVVVGEPAKPR